MSSSPSDSERTQLELLYVDDLQTAVHEIADEQYPCFEQVFTERDQPGMELVETASTSNPDTRLATVDARVMTDDEEDAFERWVSVDSRINRQSEVPDALSIDTPTSVLVHCETGDDGLRIEPIGPLRKTVENPCGEVAVTYCPNGVVYFEVEFLLPSDLDVPNPEVLPEPPTLPPSRMLRQSSLGDGRIDRLVQFVKKRWQAFDERLPPSMRRPV